MTALPAATDFTGASITESQFKTAISDLRGFLAGLVGDTGTVATALSTLGALGNTSVSKASAYTVLATDRGKFIDCSGTFTLSLTAAATLGDGFSFAVRNSGTGTITIDPNSSEQIDGAATLLLYAGESCVCMCNGTGWKSIGKASGVLAGTVSYYAATTAPSGWLKCDGSAVLRANYAALFAAIGTTFGAGDGSTTFNLPDLRGEFIRGFDDARGVDSGRVFGSAQGQDLQSHAHTVGYTSSSGSGTNLYTPSSTASLTNNASKSTSASGGTETRPRNVALLAIIKF